MERSLSFDNGELSRPRPAFNFAFPLNRVDIEIEEEICPFRLVKFLLQQ